MIKAIIFDFDGTLTKKSLNSWKKLWEIAGYNTGKDSYYAKIYKAFINGEISHTEWTRLTRECFIKRKINVANVAAVIKDIQLIDGVEDTLRILKKNNIEVHIVSGGIDPIIRGVLGENAKQFDSINSNKFFFNYSGKLTDIKPTKYDYYGKARFIEEYIEKTGIKPEEICFVGNGSNDEFAYRSGCRTICINPDDTDSQNNNIWHKSVCDLTNLKQIIPIIKEFYNTTPRKINMKQSYK